MKELDVVELKYTITATAAFPGGATGTIVQQLLPGTVMVEFVDVEGRTVALVALREDLLRVVGRDPCPACRKSPHEPWCPTLVDY